MTDSADNPYLRDAVLTATPEQLQLMLYDGALRFTMQARDAIEAGEIENSYNLLTRAQRVVREMENGLRHEIAPQLCSRMAALYRFVFSRLVDANVRRDLQALDDALKVLRHQRETWAILVDKVQQSQASPSEAPQQQPDSISVEG